MNFFSSGPNLEKQVFDLKLTSKQFDRMSAKSTKQEKAELLKARPSWRGVRCSHTLTGESRLIAGEEGDGEGQHGRG